MLVTHPPLKWSTLMLFDTHPEGPSCQKAIQTRSSPSRGKDNPVEAILGEVLLGQQRIEFVVNKLC